jgi:[acyl-carrier-protein] S-malonyltransferase
MGLPWRDHPSWQLVDRLSEVVSRDLADLLLDASPDTLRATRNAQLATYTLSLVALDAARKGPLGDAVLAEKVTAVAGHSLGEYTALVAARALSSSAGATLVQARGEAMQSAAEANPGTMAAVLGLELEGVAEACGDVDGAWVANDNSAGQVVIAGTLQGVEDASAAALKRGAKRVVPLQVGGAFHTPLMQPAQAPLDTALAAAEFATTSCPVVANVDAKAHTDDFRSLLSAQLCSQVRWRDSLLTLAGMGATLFVELGPGTELSGMVRRTVRDVARLNVAGPEDLEALASAIQ